MDKRYVHYEAINNEPDDPEREIEMYYASDVDARIAELEKFAREFLLYFTSSNGIPVERVTIKADSDIVHMARALMES